MSPTAMMEAVVVETPKNAPPDVTHWSRSSLVSKHWLRKIWRAFWLKLRAQGLVQGVRRPQLSGEGPRSRGALHSSSVATSVFVDRRETPDPSPQPHSADLAGAADDPRPGHLRLRAQPDLRSLRRPSTWRGGPRSPTSVNLTPAPTSSPS